MRIVSLETKDSSKIKINNFTVLVGPNNVGKSQTLKDIHSIMTGGINARTTIVKKIDFARPKTFKGLIEGLEITEDKNNTQQHLIGGIASNLRGGERIPINLEGFENSYKSRKDIDFSIGNISKFCVSFLDATSRLLVAQTIESNDPDLGPAQNLLQALYNDSTLKTEKELRKAFQDTFEMDIKLDYSGLRRLKLRVAREFKKIPSDPRKASPILRKHSLLDAQGDGYRSFVGVVLSMLLSKNRIVLLDEPEAFLHPAQARILGRWIATYSKKNPGQIVVATHNANFLSGILSGNQKVDIYRVNRKGNKTSYTQMTSEATSMLSKSPLLSSQRVLEAIFHKGVVICEADADRCAYEMVATQKFENKEILFIHAHNKQSIKTVATLLRNASIPVCAITDIDILDSESELKKLLESLSDKNSLVNILKIRKELSFSVEKRKDKEILKELKKDLATLVKELEENEHTLSGVRGAINRIRKSSSRWATIKEKGISGFSQKLQSKAEGIIEEAKKIGLFIVPVGELENWLDLGTKKKNKWIVLALEALYKGKCSKELEGFIKEVLGFFN
jgi:predicted ATP-dependent endonuclease of OLD family